MRYWQRPASGPRSSPARVYAFSDTRMVVVSEAEIDSVEAVLDGRLPASPLCPPARGLVAFAARLRGVREALAPKAPMLSKVLGAARRIEGVVEPEANGVRLDVALELETAEQALRAEELVERIRVVAAAGDGGVARAAQATTVTAVGRSISLRTALPPEVVLGALKSAG